MEESGTVYTWNTHPCTSNGTPLQNSCLEDPRTEEPGGLQSMGSLRAGHDWSDSAAAAAPPSASSSRWTPCSRQKQVLPFVSWIEFLAARRKLHSLTVPSLWIMNLPFLTRHFQNLKYINFLKSLPDPTSFPTTSYCPISWLPFTSKMLAVSWESLQTTKYWRRCGEKGTFVHC